MSPETRTTLANHIAAHTEETELETLVEVLGNRKAQRAVAAHTLPELVAKEQGHGMDHRHVVNVALNRRAA